jgi:hypothetical protein
VITSGYDSTVINQPYPTILFDLNKMVKRTGSSEDSIVQLVNLSGVLNETGAMKWYQQLRAANIDNLLSLSKKTKGSKPVVVHIWAT